jgi:thiosulfate/3-mercaptopyruvate sulfurtransferase
MQAGLSLAVALLCGCQSAGPWKKSDFPARETPNYQGLVSVGWVKSLLDYRQSGFLTPAPATARPARLVILEASWATLEKATDYRSGHVPSAIHFNTDDLETGYPRWQLRPAEELQEAFGRAGITPDTTVIVYGTQLIAAARVWWALKYAGVDDVRIMDGGFAAWTRTGYPVEKQIQHPQPAVFVGPVASHLLATTDLVRERLADPGTLLADVRSVAEFTGGSSGYRSLEARGRIPSAVHVGDGDDAAHLYVRPDGSLRPSAEILDGWRRQGLVPAKGGGRFEKEVIFYCGGGWRSSVAFFHAWLLGFENIRNYSDGWIGWSTEYQPEPSANGSTPGWRQKPSGNPIVAGPP